MNVKHYEVKLTVLGPVHIGNGEKLRKTEYIYEFYKNLVHIVDGAKLTKYLAKKGLLDKFIVAIEKAENNMSLFKFLKDYRVPKSDWQFFVKNSEHVNQGITNDQSDKSRNLRTKTPTTMNDLSLFIKDGQGMPYIPGSSLKGALRTVLLENDGQDNKDNPLFRKIQISDSKPLDKSNLVIYQKIDINKAAKPLPIYRECLEVGTEVIFKLSILDDAITIRVIEESIQRFYRNYQTKWLVGVIGKDSELRRKAHSKRSRIIQKMIPSQQHQILYLGGGVGFVSKTLQYQMFDKSKAKQAVFLKLQRSAGKVYRKMKFPPKNVPIALKAAIDTKKNRWYQQGICQITFTEKNEHGRVTTVKNNI